MMKSLPEDVQQIIREVGAAYEAQSGESRNVAQARAGWADSLKSFPQQQATDADGPGMPGTQVMQAYLVAVSAAGYDWPVEYTVDQV